MNKSKSEDLGKNELRRYIIEELTYKRENIRNASVFTDEYMIKLKSWCVTLFMVTTGFCLKEQVTIGSIYYFLPIIPVVFMWFLHSYKAYRISIILNHKDIKKIRKHLKNIDSYDHEKLKVVLEEVFNLKFHWKDKGKPKLKRFFKKKLPGLIKIALCNIESLFFFGGMIIIWILIIIIQGI